MKSWITVLLLLGIAISLINGQNVNEADDDYDVKRFHVQSRRLNGNPTCVVTRRKRFTQPSDDGDAFYPTTQVTDEENDEDDLADANPDTEMEVNTGDGNGEPAGLLIRDSDLNGNAGILVIQNGAASDSPVLFELRPVVSGARDSFSERDNENNPDDLNYQEYDDGSDEIDNANNRYKPISDLDSDTDDIVETVAIKRPVKPTKKPKRKLSNQNVAANSDEDRIKPKKKPKRPTYSPPRNKRKPNRRRNQNKKPNRNQTKRKNQKKKKTDRNQNKRRTNNRKRVPAGPQYQQYNLRQGNRQGGGSTNFNRNKNIGVNVNQGSGSNTVTRTVTTTHTGGAEDTPDVNCIIINKPATSTTEKPFWDILGRDAATGETDRSFGLRKRFKQKFLG